MEKDKLTEKEFEEDAIVEEETAEVPLENSYEEDSEILEEEGSLDGDAEEVEALSCEGESSEEEGQAVEQSSLEEFVEEKEEVLAELTEEKAEEDERGEEEVKPAKEEFQLTPPENLEEILSAICMKRARKLIYRPSDELFNITAEVLGTDKNNEEKISVKKILEAEIKQGVKLGYLDKFDGLKGSELKEEYENDVVYEFAEQEFKRTGLVLDGNKVKVYVFDWDMKACHHIGYISGENAELVKPYLIDREKYSFDVNGIIVGGKYKKITKDPATGKVTVEKGNDGKLGVELDVTVINRKD